MPGGRRAGVGRTTLASYASTSALGRGKRLRSGGDVCTEIPMRPSNIPRPTPAASGLPAVDTGATVRAARRAAGLTLAELGQRIGYSASQTSRYERGIQSLTDV